MLLSSHHREQEDTPLAPRSPHGRGSSIRRVPAEPPRPLCASELRRAANPRPPAARRGGAGGQPRGGVRAASPGGPRPPTGRRATTDGSAGFRERVPAPARPPRPRRPEGEAPAPPVRVRRVPSAPRVPGTRRRPLRASVRPASAPRARRPPQRTGKGREPTALRPRAQRRRRARPAARPGRGPPPTAHPPSPPARARQRPLAPAPHLRRTPAPVHRRDRLCTPEVTSPGRPRPRPRRTPGWPRSDRLGAGAELREAGEA
ncbi:proline-rich protein 2-like [Equus quagga]|uniref:proline-rich protein 2-like n=1 Tax=Equus quagga TaxID=89248 RepID=UPI001EE169F1|nr:proline-rich protein 2-like [Equus quagga]